MTTEDINLINDTTMIETKTNVRPFIMFKVDVSRALNSRWPGGSKWELIKKFEKELDGAWLNHRTAEYTADLINELFMSKPVVYEEENPTKLAKKWGSYTVVN